MLTRVLACWSEPPPPSRNEASLESLAGMQGKKRKKTSTKLEQADDYSEITQMGASREARGLEWDFASRILPE